MRLALWALISIVAGTAVLASLAVLRRRQGHSPLLQGFAFQTLAWGAVELAVAARRLHGLALRDLGAAARLSRLLWLESGLDIGFAAAGLTLVLATVVLTQGRRAGGIGAGLGIIVQGTALLALHARFIAVVNQYV